MFPTCNMWGMNKKTWWIGGDSCPPTAFEVVPTLPNQNTCVNVVPKWPCTLLFSVDPFTCVGNQNLASLSNRGKWLGFLGWDPLGPIGSFCFKAARGSFFSWRILIRQTELTVTTLGLVATNFAFCSSLLKMNRTNNKNLPRTAK